VQCHHFAIKFKPLLAFYTLKHQVRKCQSIPSTTIFENGNSISKKNAYIHLYIYLTPCCTPCNSQPSLELLISVYCILIDPIYKLHSWSPVSTYIYCSSLGASSVGHIQVANKPYTRWVFFTKIGQIQRKWIQCIRN